VPLGGTVSLTVYGGNWLVNDPVSIQSRDYWFKVTEMLQQNWALIDSGNDGAKVYFVTDTSGVFDELAFASEVDADAALRRNDFRRFSEDPRAASYLRCPEPPFRHSPHPNGPIYSSGRFWKSTLLRKGAGVAGSRQTP
jgi:hypothetical protein